MEAVTERTFPWPVCLTEAETVDRILAGDSLSRFGDGELGIALGSGNSTHAASADLAAELRAILKSPPPGLLPAIPTMDPRISNFENWARSGPRYYRILDPKRVYGSAFLGRPKAAPWVADPAHLARYRSLWRGRRVVGVGPADHPLGKLIEPTAASFQFIECPASEAYSEADRIVKACRKSGADLAVLCAGPAATAMAARLCSLGMQAVDIGRGSGVMLKAAVQE